MSAKKRSSEERKQMQDLLEELSGIGIEEREGNIVCSPELDLAMLVTHCIQTKNIDILKMYLKVSSVYITGIFYRHSMVKIYSSPPVRFYHKFGWASKSLCLLAQKVY